jgi:ankyrin repeat protein
VELWQLNERLNYFGTNVNILTTMSDDKRNSSPLLLLLDGVLSQDEQSIDLAMEQLHALDPSLRDIRASPLRSSTALEYIVHVVMQKRPQLAQVASESDGSTPAHFAASIGNVKVAGWLLETYPAAALMHNKKGKIPLHYAAREGRMEMVHFLLQRYPKSAAVMTRKLKLPIHFAAGDGHVEVVRALLRANPSGASTPSKKGKVALHFAARWGHMTIARDLVRLCPRCVEMLDYDGSLPLHDAVREGQLEMARFLVERYPQGMTKANIRGELPLFGAIRSGNVDLCAFLIRSWPASGKHVLQMVRAEDNVGDWDPAILDMCLRGAVNNFSDVPEEHVIPSFTTYSFSTYQDCSHSTPSTSSSSTAQSKPGRPRALTCLDRDSSGSSQGSAASMEVSMIVSSAAAQPFAGFLWAPADRLTPGLDITLPRSKSPMLDDGISGQKRSAADGTNFSKKSRKGSLGDDEKSRSSRSIASEVLARNTFYQLHAALETSASLQVLECVVNRHSEEQLTQADDFGKLPLHVALEHCRSPGSVDLILDRIWKPYMAAASRRDYLGRLPLHLALLTRADSLLIKPLLEANPSSGVEYCDAVDPRFGDKLPIHVATENGCDLSTIFLLVKGDPTAVQSWKATAC